MGCVFGKCTEVTEEQENTNAVEVPQATYSWERRAKLDPKEFMFDGLINEERVKLPGSINGQQFLIRNCKQSSLYVFDVLNSINVDDCEDCKIFIGPCQTSVFIRDCKNCDIVVACQQLRLRDCHRLSIFLSCVSQPIIEASSHIRFGPYQYHYPDLKRQFEIARLSVFNSTWSDVYDFTQVEHEKNFSLISEEKQLLELVPLPSSATSGVDFTITSSVETSVVPLTHGARRKPSDESCFVALFGASDLDERAWRLLRELQLQSNCLLVKTRETTLASSEAANLFRFEIPPSFSGPVIGFEYNGTGCIETVQRVIKNLEFSDHNIYVSSDSQTAQTLVERFYGIVSMHMNAS